MENQKLLERLNILWAFLEEEGYYTKSNTVFFALKYIEGLEKEIKDLRELAGPTLCKQHDLHNGFMKERTRTLIDTIDSDTFTSDPGAGIECGKVGTPELKPCPFCGGEAISQPNRDGTGGYIGCGNLAGCLMPYHLYDAEDGPNSAITAWNARSIIEELKGENDDRRANIALEEK